MTVLPARDVPVVDAPAAVWDVETVRTLVALSGVHYIAKDRTGEWPAMKWDDTGTSRHVSMCGYLNADGVWIYTVEWSAPPEPGKEHGRLLGGYYDKTDIEDVLAVMVSVYNDPDFDFGAVRRFR